MPRELKEDNEIVHLAINGGASLEHVPESYLNDRELVSLTITRTPSNIAYIPEKYKDDIDFILDCLKAIEKQGDTSLIKTFIKNLISPKMIEDKDFIEEWQKQDVCEENEENLPCNLTEDELEKTIRNLELLKNK